MHKREIKLPDGRYLVFYSFGDDAAHPEVREGVPAEVPVSPGKRERGGAAPPAGEKR